MKQHRYITINGILNARLLTLNTIFLLALSPIMAQPVFTPWGNINGIHVEGEKMRFETSIRSVLPEWTGFIKSEKYNWEGEQTYKRTESGVEIQHFLQSTPINYKNILIETGKGMVSAEVAVKADKPFQQNGTYFCIEVMASDFGSGKFTFYKSGKEVALFEPANSKKDKQGNLLTITADKVVLKSLNREYTMNAEKATEICIRRDISTPLPEWNDPLPYQVIVASHPQVNEPNIQLYFKLLNGNAKKGQTQTNKFDISVSGTLDTSDVVVNIDTKNPGRIFDGIGGNYRLQFPDKDPAVIKYCLDSLNVTWARVPLFWDEFHPNELSSPDSLLYAGKLSERFMNQIKLTQQLAQYGAKIVLAIWAPPAWAIDTTIKVPKGVVLNNQKLEQIGQSIASYLLYLKREHGVEVEYFSFNEPDYGVEVYHTPQNHLIQNKAIGLVFAKNGLKTKILIADTGAGTAKARNIFSDIETDAQMHQYSGAIAFHTYHGCTNPDLLAWADAANKNNLPIMVAEGGTNSAAHRYGNIFLEPWFQLEEIDTYIRICNICQPVTILEWQLTSDYSVLTGGGNYGDKGPLRPTQRYWNLKQLSLSSGQFALTTQSNTPNISVASFGNALTGNFTLHLVNNGATRTVKLSGLPSSVKELQPYLTNANKGMELGQSVKVVNGEAEVAIEAQSFVTLTANQ